MASLGLINLRARADGGLPEKIVVDDVCASAHPQPSSSVTVSVAAAVIVGDVEREGVPSGTANDAADGPPPVAARPKTRRPARLYPRMVAEVNADVSWSDEFDASDVNRTRWYEENLIVSY